MNMPIFSKAGAEAWNTGRRSRNPAKNEFRRTAPRDNFSWSKTAGTECVANGLIARCLPISRPTNPASGVSTPPVPRSGVAVRCGGLQRDVHGSQPCSTRETRIFLFSVKAFNRMLI